MPIPLPPYEAPFLPVPQVTPLTYRDGLTLLKKLDQISRYINKTLVPFVNDNYEELAEAFETQVNALIEAVNAAIDMIINGSVEVQDPVVAELIADIDSLTRDALNAYIAASADVIDPVVTAILEDVASTFRVSADIIYGGQVPADITVPKVTALADLQAAFDAASLVGGRVWASGVISTSATLNIKTSCDLTGVKLTHTGATTTAVSITADNVTVDGLTITGPGASVHQSGSRGISVVGTVGAYRKNVKIRNLTITEFREAHVWLNFVDGFSVENCVMDQAQYAGVHCFSVNNGTISHNRISNIKATPLAYGITVNKAVDSEANAPRSTDVIVANNIISKVTNWEGIDTHGGVRINISDNIVNECMIGIAIVPAKTVVAGEDTLAPKDVTVVGNIIDSKVTNGSADFGISFAGAKGAIVNEYASGTIVGNVIRNHGKATDDFRGALYLRTTRALTVIGNQIVNPSPHGINILADNEDIVVANNNIVEHWGAAGASRNSCIIVRDANNNGTVTGNRHSANGEHAGAFMVNNAGFGIVTSATNDFMVHTNEFTSCTTPFNGSTTAIKMQFLHSAPTARATALSAINASTVDATYGNEERDVINNVRGRVNQIEALLQALWFVA